jgi:carbon-monoxide dehydrogenase small subunit
MAATGLIEESGGEISDEEIREGLEGNLCRCTGYEMIVRSVRWAIDNAPS